MQILNNSHLFHDQSADLGSRIASILFCLESQLFQIYLNDGCCRIDPTSTLFLMILRIVYYNTTFMPLSINRSMTIYKFILSKHYIVLACVWVWYFPWKYCCMYVSDISLFIPIWYVQDCTVPSQLSSKRRDLHQNIYQVDNSVRLN